MKQKQRKAKRLEHKSISWAFCGHEEEGIERRVRGSEWEREEEGRGKREEGGRRMEMMDDPQLSAFHG